MTILATLFDCLAGVADETAEEIATAIQHDFGEYRHFANDEQEQTWRSGLRGTLGRFIEAGMANRGLNPDERRRIAAIGETRAEQGVPLDVVLGSVRLAMHVALSAVRRHARELREVFGFEEAVDEMSLRMTRFVNGFSTEISRGYIARSEARATSLERDRAQYGSDLLAGVFLRYADAAVTGAALALSVPPTLGFVLVPGSGPTHAPLVGDIGRAVPSALIVPIGSTLPHTVLIVPTPTTSDWTDATKLVADVVARHRATALVVDPCEGPQAWHACYVEAAASLGLASSFAMDRSVIEARELLPAQLVTAGPPATLRAINREVLAPLREHSKGRKLLRALDAFMRTDGSPKAAARLLGVAVTTARTYKATIEEVTNLRFGCPGDAMRLGIGWLLLRVLDGMPLAG